MDFYRRLGFDPAAPVDTFRLARKLLGPNAIERGTAIVGLQSKLFAVHGERRIAVGRKLSTEHAPFYAGHELGHIVLDELGYREDDLDPLLVHAVIQVESGYNQYAISHAGAQGLMQLMPATARSLGVRNSFDVEENIRAGVRHLKDLKETFKDDRLALAAYNAGAGAVDKYRWIPPYPETQEYVYKVGKKYGEARRAAAVQAVAKPAVPPPTPTVTSDEPETRQVESFVDAEGRLHMRTK